MGIGLLLATVGDSRARIIDRRRVYNLFLIFAFIIHCRGYQFRSIGQEMKLPGNSKEFSYVYKDIVMYCPTKCSAKYFKVLNN